MVLCLVLQIDKKGDSFLKINSDQVKGQIFFTGFMQHILLIINIRTRAIYGLWGFMGICIDSIDYRPRSEGDNVLGSIRPPSALSRLKSHYQSKVFVCVSNSRADAVDRLLIFYKSRLDLWGCMEIYGKHVGDTNPSLDL